MHQILKLLTADLDAEDQESVSRRVKAMNSELAFLQENKPKLITEAKKCGWTSEKLQVLFCLNSFYQRILVPLWASTTPPAIFGSKVPIRYGRSIVFDAERNASVNQMGNRFLALCLRLAISRQMLEAQRVNDIIRRITKNDASK